METFLRSFSCPCNGVHCTAAVQPVARLLNFVVAYFLRLVYKTITFLLWGFTPDTTGGDHDAPPDNLVAWGVSQAIRRYGFYRAAWNADAV